jgi:hopanoid biosynthesis associated RND transporter like protein HpnN
VVLAVLAVAVLATWQATTRFEMNSRMGDLIRQDAPWRAHVEAFEAAFPQFVDTAVLVVDGDSREAVARTTRTLADRLAADAAFTDVFAPSVEPVLDRHALLFLDVDALDRLVSRLAEAQPLLAVLADDPALPPLLDRLAEGVARAGPGPLESALAGTLSRLAASARRAADGEAPPVAWLDAFLGDVGGAGAGPSLITVRGAADYGEALPNAAVVARLREHVAAVDAPEGVRVRLTGEVVLAHEEIAAARAGVQLAGGLSLALLAAVLVLGVRSLRVVVATVALLAAGIAWTAGWATFAVGTWNTLSLIFLVLFFGLGVDFAVHFCLRVQEALGKEAERDDALGAAVRSVGGPVALCAATSALAFAAFVPTDYRGLAELGIVSAGGMAIAFVLTFTLIPAVFALIGLPRPLVPRAPAPPARRRDGAVLLAAAVWTLLAAGIATRAHFDFSVLALRDPDSESLSTQRDLQAREVVTDYSLSVLVPPEADLDALAARLEALDVVAAVRRPEDVLPADPATKRAILADAAFLLGSTLDGAGAATPAASPPRALDAARARLLAAVRDADARGVAAPDLEALAALDAAGLARLERAALARVPAMLADLDARLAAGALAWDDLPGSLRDRLVADDGRRLLRVLPAEDTSAAPALARFVEGVRAVAPAATGRPVVEWGVGRIVVEAFATALGGAVLVVALLLLAVLRRPRAVLLVMAPLGLSALTVLAVTVLAGMPLNMANVLVLPLVFGLGVDSGIHVVRRWLDTGSASALAATSTPRAVLLSALTTLGTFAALALSPHRGTASIGVLLAVAIVALLVTTLVLLPALLRRLPAQPRPTGSSIGTRAR